MSLPIDTMTKNRDEAKTDNTNIGDVTFVTVTVRDINDKTREG